MNKENPIDIYQSHHFTTQVQVRSANDSIRLFQVHMSMLFFTDIRIINELITYIFHF